MSSNLIVSDDSSNELPDELRTLGVCAFDEKTFEKGIIDQMQLELNEFESGHSSEMVDEAEGLEGNMIKKRKMVGDSEERKKARTSNEFDGDELNGISYSPLMDEGNEEDQASNIEWMIKNGEMTPFGTVVDFEQKSTKQKTAEQLKLRRMSSTSASSSGKKSTTNAVAAVHDFNQVTEFDSFLMDFDAKAKKKPKVKKVERNRAEKKPSPVYKDTNNTDFDLFLNGFDSSKVSKSSDKKLKSSKSVSTPVRNDPNKNQARPSTSSATSGQVSIKNGSDDGVKKKPAKALDFDSQLLSIDEQLSAKKLGKSKSESKLISQKSVSEKQAKIKSKETPVKKGSSISITKISKPNLEKSKPSVKSSHSKPAKFSNQEKTKLTMDSSSFARLIEDVDDSKSNESLVDLNLTVETSKNRGSLFEGLENSDDDEKDLDYDAVSDRSGESDYETDEDEDPIEARKRKRRLKRTCMDDGDDDVYLKRMKRLERYERNLLRMEEADGEEIEDLDEMSKSVGDGDSDLDQSAVDLYEKNMVVNNNRHIELEATLKVPEKIWNKLYKFQKTALKWFWELHSQRCGGILGDEMGLGKTVQVAAYLATIKYSRIRSVGFSYIGLGPVLIVAPLTLISQWVTELHTWWPYFRVNVLHEIGTNNDKVKKKLIDKTFECNGILITTYQSLLIYDSELIARNWHYVILDEGHKIRNPDAKVTIIAKCFRTPHRIILSGSPIQNNLKELWSLFDFVFPGKLGTIEAFLENFSVPINQGGYSNASDVQVQTAYKCACILRNTIAPYLLRRVKSDVKLALQLPEKNEQILFCRLSKEQKEEYTSYLNSRECKYLLKTKTKILAALVQLRKICNHTDILTDKFYKNPQWVNHSDYDLAKAGEHGYFKRSGKMIVVDTLLRLWKKQEGRVLLFSQSRAMLDILEKYAQEQEYSYYRMDGTTAAATRAKLVENFNKNSSIFLFLLTTKVGGLGINLTGANKIIIFDPDWNPSNDLQARERSWRIGQSRNVTIYRLLTSGTIEEKIYHRQIFKTFLSNKILKDPRQKRFFKANDMHELFSYTCVDDKMVESSALLAGTGSEIKAKKLKAKYIPNLTKIRKGKNGQDNDEEEKETSESFKKSDDYVLSKLFKAKKKNGGQSYIHTAIQHDKVVDSSLPDYSLVEAEASRVANEAVRALKESRKFCRTADTGIPNLHGLKFGSKLKVSSNTPAKPFISKSTASAKPTENRADFSSMSLLDRIKLRNKCIHQEEDKPKKAEDSNEQDGNKDDDYDDECSQVISDLSALNPIERANKMSAMIKEYFVEKTGFMNRCSTAELVDYFRHRTIKEDGPKFKAILKKMCDFSEARNTWSLKDEYFNL